MSEDQEKVTKTENESSEVTVEDTKTELATMYLNFLDKNKGGILGTGAGIGINLNPLQKDAIEYLTTDAVKDKTDFFSNIGKNIKKKFVEKFTGGTMLEYNKASLSKMKALITQYKDDKTKLQDLMAQIAAGIDPTVENISDQTKKTPVDDTKTTNTENTEDTENTTNIAEYEAVDKFATGKNITTYLSLLTGGITNRAEAKKIIETQLVKHMFMGTELSVNKYMLPALEAVEKAINESTDSDVKNYVFKNMSTYNRRNAKGSSSLSYHALGLAIDIDPANNPMVETTWPTIKTNIPPALIEIFNTHGFIRGGNWGNIDRKKGEPFTSDAMHFEFKDIDYLTSVVNKKEDQNQTV